MHQVQNWNFIVLPVVLRGVAVVGHATLCTQHGYFFTRRNGEYLCFHIAVSGAIIEARFSCTCIVFARTCGYLKLLLTGKELEPNKTGRSTDLNIFYEIRL